MIFRTQLSAQPSQGTVYPAFNTIAEVQRAAEAGD